MNPTEDRPRTGHNQYQEHERPSGAESPHNLLAVHDPSKRRPIRGQGTAGRGHGVSVQWVRPTELAARIAARTAAGAVAAHLAAHRQVRDGVRSRLAGTGNGRLAPASAFGRQAQAEQRVADRSVIGR